jgi:hypothetical protein
MTKKREVLILQTFTYHIPFCLNGMRSEYQIWPLGGPHKNSGIVLAMDDL